MSKWWDEIEEYSELTLYKDASALLTFDQLVEHVAGLRGDVDGVLLAATIASLATKIPPLESAHHPEYPEANAWNIALAMLAALRGRPAVPLVGDGKLITPKDTTQHALSVLRKTPALWSAPRTASKQAAHEEAQLAVIEMLASQYALQPLAVHDVARSRILLGLDGFEDYQPEQIADIDELVRSAYGHGIDLISSAAFATWIAATRDAIINTHTVAKAAADPGLIRSAMTAYLDAHSLPVEEVRAALETLPANRRTQGLANQFFDLHPFLKLSGKHADSPRVLLAAPHPYLLERVSMGLVRRVFALARDRAGGQTDNAFQNDFGLRSFEPYIGALLRKYCPNSEVFAEYWVEAEGTRDRTRSPDWIVLQGDDVVLIECKILRLKPGTFFGYSLDEVREDHTNPKRVPRPFVQIVRFLERAAMARSAGKLDPETQRITERVLDAKRRHLVGLFMQIPPLTLESDVHGWVRGAVPKISLVSTDSMTVLSATDLEWLLALNLGDRLGEVLWAYEQRIAGRTLMPLDEARSGVLLTLRDFARRVPGAGPAQPLPVLEEVYWRFADMVNRQWFGQPVRRPR